MKKDIKKISKKVQTSPGTLEHIGKEGEEEAHLKIIEFNQEFYSNKAIIRIKDLDFEKKESTKWVKVVGLKDLNIIKDIGEHFNLHPLLLEDVLNTTQHPKIEDYDKYIFVLAKLLKYDEIKNEISTEQISFVLFEDMLITFQEFTDDVFDNVMERIVGGSSIRKRAEDFLFYSLFDAVVDNYFIVLEEVTDKMDLLEDKLIGEPDKEVLQGIYELKREMIYVRNSIWPLRNIISKLTKNEYSLINEHTIYYLRDVYDHIVQMIDIIETYRDILSGMLDIYVSSIGNKTNEVMKVLTIFSTIFIPLTFLTGIYGMNFINMPELNWKYSYITFWIISLGILIITIQFFRKKKWL